MGGKRDVLASVAARSGLLGIVRAGRRLYLRDVRILAYHRILPKLEEATYPFDPDLVSAWTEDFDWQMKYVAERFDVLTCRDVVESIDNGKRLPRRPLVVTFDDGFVDNHAYAYPILRRHKVPAVIFLATGYIGSEETFWFDWLAYALMRTDTMHVPASEIGVVLDLSGGIAQRRLAIKSVLRHIKQVQNDERHAILRKLQEILNVRVLPSDRKMSAALNWEQVQAMAGDGIEFGSHTVTHPVLSRVSDAGSLDHELSESRMEIERRTGQPVVALAYPVGGQSAINDRVIDAVARAGYRMALTYESGLNVPGRWDRFRLKRLPVERYLSRDMFRALIEMPEVFGHGA